MRAQGAGSLAEWQGRFVEVLPPEAMAELAAQAKFGQRNRKLTPVRFLVTLVFGWAVEEQRTLASLRRFFAAVTGIAVVSSAFQTRFTAAAVDFLRGVYLFLLRKVEAVQGGLPMALSRFKEVLAFDGSVISLRDKLARHFRACRTNHTKAALKLHAAVSLRDNAIVELDARSERYGERRFLSKFIGQYEGRLLLFDLGYFSHKLFARIDKAKAFFVSRLKDSSNPVIVEVKRGIRSTRAAIGTRLDDNDFEGPVVEVLVHISGAGSRLFRLVGLRFPGTQDYRFYLTNLIGVDFSAEDIASLYTRRWQIELVFKELKSLCRIDQMPTAKPNTVLCLLYASLIAILVSRLFAAAVEQTKTTTKRVRRTVVTKCLSHFAREAAAAFAEGGTRLRELAGQLLTLLNFAAPDPNLRRIPNRVCAVTC
jgi:putative transposase